ncbi:bifunctional metallophosphatase/5'-nucleotidase [Vibrio astriarenae]|uniref:Bifunctional metallophosphatase/5'-nucleotidase n=1 Tax=Vibrio astriarenae TaxID=1481923 RepID=A0A7Z2T2E0_9VIBR|nr:5'-nucleotidase C-terminal domain-containing protein [Vibrio astriarenae]QIA62995.1 bifunctional metallophosphatase/5'-nucleotidase [Vibrio astriarenae]
MYKFSKPLSLVAAALVVAGCNSSDDNNTVVNPPVHLPELEVCKTFQNKSPMIVRGNNPDLFNQTITIGATGDMHGRIWAYDYALDAEDVNAGFTKIATLLHEERANAENMLMIDLGDTVQGNSAELFNSEPVHPVVETMNFMDYDLWVPGNHEFDFERSFLFRNLEGFKGSIISSNIIWEDNITECKTEGQEIPLLPPYQVYEFNGARVAIVGLTPSWVKVWQAASPDNFRNLDFKDEFTSVESAVNEVIDVYNPDVVIGALHYGRKENGDGVHKIASKLADKFDVIFMGHEHARFIEQVEKDSDYTKEMLEISKAGEAEFEDKSISGEYNSENRHTKVKVIEPGNWGWALAKAEIELEKDDNGKWQIVDTTLSNLKVDEIEEDTALQAEMQWVHDESVADANELIGEVKGNFTNSANGGADEATGEEQVLNNDGLRLYTTIHNAKLADAPLSALINDIQIMNIEEKGPEGIQVDVSAAAIFSDGSNLFHGQEYKKKDSANLYMYDNELVAVSIKGEQLKDYMEWSYSYFNQYVEGDITVSFNPDMPAFNYDIFGGTIKYVVDLSKQGRVEDSEGNKITDGERIEIVEIAGTDFDADATYTLAVNDYRYGTTMLAKGWITEADNLWQSTNEPVYAVRDMLTAYVDDKELLDRADFDYQNWYIKQYGIVEADGTITNPGSMIETRQDEGAGQDLWEQLQNKEICILRAEAGARSSIHKAVNINDASTYFANPLFGSAEGDALYQGCIYANQP